MLRDAALTRRATAATSANGLPSSCGARDLLDSTGSTDAAPPAGECYPAPLTSLRRRR